MAIRPGRLVGLAVSVATAALLGLPSAAFAASASPADDPVLTLTPAAGGTTLIGGVGAAFVHAAPYTLSGGTGQDTWAYTGLPEGLDSQPSSGLIGGTPTLPGSFDVTLTVTDQDGQTQSGPVTVDINTIGLATASGPLLAYVVAVVNEPVDTSVVTATGDTFEIAWGASGLPAGLQIDRQSGQISGTPTTVGAVTATIGVINGAGDTASLPVLFETVVGYTCNYQQTGHVGTAMAINCGVFWSPKPNQGGRWLAMPGHLGYAGKGLPQALHINSATGVITGTPRRAGTTTSTVSVSVRSDGILLTGPTTWRSTVRCSIKR